MMRKFAIVLVALCGALTGSIASALGMGELTLQSALNQQFKAEIRLLNVGDLSKNQMIASLASQDNFERAGVERVFFLTGIKFDVVYNSPEDVRIRLTTDKIVREPFLNFLVELHWPSGRLLREFTVLLDPPAFSEAPPAPVGQARVESTKQATSPIAAAKTVGETSARGAPQTDNRVRIKKNDTLWSIARDHRPEDALSIRQTMLSIQKNNPHAFINNNINLIKAGQVLEIPSASEIRNFSSEQAILETQRQNEAWKSRELASSVEQQSGEDVSGSGKPAAAVAATLGEVADDEGRLKLISEDAEDDDLLAASAATEFEMAMEEGVGAEGASTADQQGSPVSESGGQEGGMVPSSEVELLRAELEKLQKRISIKDDQLAQLQASLANRNTSSEGTQKTVDNAGGKENAPGTTMGDGLFGNALYIGGLIFLVLAGLVIYGIISRRREESGIYPRDLQKTLDNAQDEIEFDDDFESELDLIDSTLNDGSKQHAPDHEVDVSKYIEEADIYIAYGRYERAVEMLKSAIDEHPDNQNLRLKLAEIYITTADATGLAEQEGALDRLRATDALAYLEQLKSGAEGDEPDVDLEEFVDDTVEPLSEREALAELDFSLNDEDASSAADDNFDDFELSLDDADNVLGTASQEVTTGSAVENTASDDIDFLGDVDEVSTKLELAHAYIDMEDSEAATEILKEVLEEGSEDQRNQAQELLSTLS